MKKKIIIITILILFFLIILGIIKWNNRVISTIIMDINPSIKINLTKNNKVINVIGLNNDAKDLIKEKYKNKSLDNTLELIIQKVIDKGYTDDRDIFLILYSTGDIKNEILETKIKTIFNKSEINANITIIEKITKEDEKTAKKYNISISKAAYINSIKKDNKNINEKDLINKPVNELNETKNTGRYCQEGYILNGDWCLKEVNRVKAIPGEVCPNGYLEYEGKCYEEVAIEETDNLICREEFNLEDKECVRRIVVDAIVDSYICSEGEIRTKAEVGQTEKGAGNANEPVCVDPASITHPVSPCQLPADDPTERMSYGGTCYWHRAPVIESGCPGKIQVNEFCWDDASNIYLCPYGNNSNTRTADDYCYRVINITPTPNSYRCDDDMKLENTKCIKEEKEPAEKEKICPNGYTLVNNDRCINTNKIVNKETGLICENEEYRLKGNECIIYEKIEAKK